MNDILKRRMSSAQQASELQVSDEAYAQIFRKPLPSAKVRICELPIDKLQPFYTADIGFHPYPPDKLKAFSEQLSQEGLFERIIVREIPHLDCYEILAGHNRTEAGKMAGWNTIPAEIVEADDDRAITIAISTNLLRRQGLTIVERGKAYKALLDAKNHQGYRTDMQTSGENRQKYSARELVADFFGVTEYEIRKAIKLTQLIPALADIVENKPKQLNLACADLIAVYDAEAQESFIEMCTMEGYQLNKSTVQHIRSECPPPSAQQHQIFAAWRAARAKAERRLREPPKKISFERKQFTPYLEHFQSDEEIAALFLEFLKHRVN